MANIVLFTGSCSIEDLYVNTSTHMNLPVLPFDKNNITSSNYSNFTLSVTINNTPLLANAPFIDATHINKRSGGPRGTIQSYQAGSDGWGIRLYNDSGATISFSTTDDVVMTLIGPEEFAPVPPEPPVPTLDFSQFVGIKIPDNDYRALEYIYMDGNRYFDLGEIGFSGCFEFDVTLGSLTGSTRSPIFGFTNYGLYHSGTTPTVGFKAFTVGQYGNNKLDVSFGSKDSASDAVIRSAQFATLDSGYYLTDRNLIKFFEDSNGINIKVYDENEDLISSASSNEYTHASMGYQKAGFLSEYIYDTDSSTYKFRYAREAYVYRFAHRLTENGTLLSNWVPAQRKSDSVVGLYDTVNHVFMQPVLLSNGNPTTATAGPITEESPSWAQQYDVIKITDPNGVVLWASAAAYPYRKLEYVKFSGAEYFPTGFTNKRSKRFEITFSIDSYPATSAGIMSAYGAASETKNIYVYTPIISATGTQTWRCSTDSSVGKTTKEATYLPLNTKRRARWNISQSDSSYNAMLNYYLYDDSGNSLYSGQVTGEYGAYPTSAEAYVMAINQNGTAAGFATGKVYSIQRLTTSSTPTLEVNFVPCQRKADGVCGFYDVLSATFVPIVGTTITDGAAGPVVEENWDPTNN